MCRIIYTVNAAENEKYCTGVLRTKYSTVPLTATSVRVSWTQPPLGFTPVSYTLELELDQTHCTGFEDSIAPIPIQPWDMPVEVTGREKASTYTVTVHATFSQFGVSSTTTASLLYNTPSACE